MSVFLPIVHISWMRGEFTAFAECFDSLLSALYITPKCPFHAQLSIYLGWGVNSRHSRSVLTYYLTHFTSPQNVHISWMRGEFTAFVGFFDLLLNPLYITPKCPFFYQLSIYLGWGVNSRHSRSVLTHYLTHFTSPQNAHFMHNCPYILDERRFYGIRGVFWPIT